MEINGHELLVEKHGPADGQAVVLLHHGLGSVRAWRAQVPALVKAGFQVILYDRWGYGGSAPRPAFDIPAFQADREDLRALLDRLGVERATLVGHSDGGTLALYFAAEFPPRVTGLVLAAAHIYVDAKMISGIEALHQVYETDAGFRAGLQRIHGEKAAAVFDNWFNGWRRPENLAWDLHPALARITCPALVIQGIEDEHATPQHARDLARALPQSEIWLAPGAAHMLPQEDPGAFNRRLADFLGLLPVSGWISPRPES